MLFICDSLLHSSARDKRQAASVILARRPGSVSHGWDGRESAVVATLVDEAARCCNTEMSFTKAQLFWDQDCHFRGGKDCSKRKGSLASLASCALGHLL